MRSACVAGRAHSVAQRSGVSKSDGGQALLPIPGDGTGLVKWSWPGTGLVRTLDRFDLISLVFGPVFTIRSEA